ncbi:MAG: universal stress protein [Candidatus Latescibacterota bacterium]|jgi:nucleotide-binding universal stress UspA family protein|nr:MAG: universal stress protein [Candidatus Latescibacterota bacterium]
MPAIRTVIFTTDFSETANHALPYAIKMAKIFETELVMLHAVTLYEHDPNDPGHRFPSLDDYCAELRKSADLNLQFCMERAGEAGVPVRKTVVQSVTPHAGIIDFAKEQGEGVMIVMSTHGRSGLSHVLLGSVTENVIRYAPCPVLAVKHPEHEFIDPKTGEVVVRKILFPLDFSKDSLKPLDLVRFIAARHAAEVVLFHAIDVDIPPIYYTAGIESVLQLDPGLHDRMEKKMRDLVGGGLAGIDARYVVADGRAVTLIRDLAVREKVDLIVMASSGSHGIGDFLFGSTAARVIQKAVCPVLVV